MRYEELSYTNKTGILAFPDHYVAAKAVVDSTLVTAVDGKKILPAGTVVGGATGFPFLADTANKIGLQNDADAEGILLEDVDVTYGDAYGAVLIHGFVNLDKLPTAPDAAAKTALAGRVVFVGE